MYVVQLSIAKVLDLVDVVVEGVADLTRTTPAETELLASVEVGAPIPVVHGIAMTKLADKAEVSDKTTPGDDGVSAMMKCPVRSGRVMHVYRQHGTHLDQSW